MNGGGSWAAARGGGGGSHDGVQDERALVIIKHVSRGEAQDGYPLVAEPGVAALVGVVVALAVDLDGRPMRGQLEIENIGADGVLAAEA